jgi:4-aminobutyrate aminotransferase
MQKLNLPGEKAKALIERDKKVVSTSYPRAYPFVMDHGKGVDVWDVDGNHFLDFAAGIAVVSTGHSHPDVVEAIQKQAQKFIHISSDFYHENMINIAEELDQISPFEGPSRVFLTNSGTESVEGAIKLARYHTGRTQIIGFLGGFHGRTYGALTLTASKADYHRGFYPMANGVTHIPYPNPYRQILASHPGEDYGETVLRYLEEQVFQRLVPPDDVAAIVVEPIQGEGGYIVPPKSFFQGLRKVCDQHGILLIADEVQSGMGRTGKWWAIQNFDVEPDIVVSAKGIASGMPFGAIIARKHIMNWSKGSHGNTYGGNPISCAAASATIKVIREGYLENAAEVGAYTIEKAKRLLSKHPSIGEVRGIGLMIGIEFVLDRETKKPAGELSEDIVRKAFERGVLFLGCGKNTIRISPPLMVTKEQVDFALEALDEAISLSEREFEIVVA